jgi:ankyrin repeat protein
VYLGSDGEGVSVLYHAIDHDCAPIVSLLMDHVDRLVARPLAIAPWHSHQPIVVHLLQGVDIEQRDKLRDTALTFAAKNGALECMKLLVSRGADTSARDAEGSTVLLASLINGYAPLVKYLLTAGTHTTHDQRMCEQ